MSFVAQAARPHDLLWLKCIPQWHDAPEWVGIALARLPVVVVRRAGAPKGLVSVGVRGESRSQRYGALISIAEIERCAGPEMLLDDVLPDRMSGLPLSVSELSCAQGSAQTTAGFIRPPRDVSRAGLPAFMVLQGLAPVLRRFRLVWGPTGSVGFELATGLPVVQAGSDLDVLIRLPEWIGRDTGQSLLRTLSTQAAQAGVRIDAQLETPGGAVSLAEYAGSTRRVLLRGSGEPIFVDDPWAWGATSQSSTHGSTSESHDNSRREPTAALAVGTSPGS